MSFPLPFNTCFCNQTENHPAKFAVTAIAVSVPAFHPRPEPLAKESLNLSNTIHRCGVRSGEVSQHLFPFSELCQVLDHLLPPALRCCSFSSEKRFLKTFKVSAKLQDLRFCCCVVFLLSPVKDKCVSGSGCCWQRVDEVEAPSLGWVSSSPLGVGGTCLLGGAGRGAGDPARYGFPGNHNPSP